MGYNSVADIMGLSSIV